MISYNLPELMENKIHALVGAGFYPDESAVLKDALRTLLNVKSNLKISSAIKMYMDEKVSLSRAAEISGMSTIEFKDILASKGITRETEGKSAKEMDKKINKIFHSVKIGLAPQQIVSTSFGTHNRDWRSDISASSSLADSKRYTSFSKV